MSVCVCVCVCVSPSVYFPVLMAGRGLTIRGMGRESFLLGMGPHRQVALLQGIKKCFGPQQKNSTVELCLLLISPSFSSSSSFYSCKNEHFYLVRSTLLQFNSLFILVMGAMIDTIDTHLVFRINLTKRSCTVQCVLFGSLHYDYQHYALWMQAIFINGVHLFIHAWKHPMK